MNAGAYGGETAHVLRESTYLDLTDLSVHTIPLSVHNFGYRESIYKHSNFIILSAVFELQKGNPEEIGAMMNDFMNRRITKQPLEYPSAGSVFKRYPGRFTGQMIEEAGLKGYAIGGAQVSEKHAGFIINRSNATASDVIALVEHIKKVILEQFGCELECEMIYVK
jgi:UDP-N-acetylmuramate dehydrogenase